MAPSPLGRSDASQGQSPKLPGPLQGPSPKDRRYDRQLRLWAAHGQQALEEAHVLVVNSGSGAVGVEILKNLVLPGLGQCTILDPARVTQQDLGVNFFLDRDSIGDSRAKQASRLLGELNPDSQCHFLSDSLERCLDDPKFTDHLESRRPYTVIVIVSPALPSSLTRISQYAQKYAIPLIYVHSVGFLSHFSTVLPSVFPIVETHPEPLSTTDLRLLNPWPELKDVAAKMTASLLDLDEYEHGHIPYLVLLLHYLEVWKKSHNGKTPQNYQEKVAFRELVSDGARTNNAEGGEENYDEAVAAVLKSLNPPSLSSSVRDVLFADECQNIDHDSADFWVMMSALATFHKEHSMLPLTGSLPDMKARSAVYITLQNVFKDKARCDQSEVLRTVRQLEEQHGREHPISEKSIEGLCKNAGSLKLIRSQPLRVAEHTTKPHWGDRAPFAIQQLQDSTSLLPLYIAFLAYDQYLSMPNDTPLDSPQEDDALRPQALAPGNDPETITTANAIMASLSQTILRDMWAEVGQAYPRPLEKDEQLQVAEKRTADYARELVRAGGSELHNVSALTGGMVAQEIIKIITKQYVPVDNICLFDGVSSQIQEMKL